MGPQQFSLAIPYLHYSADMTDAFRLRKIRCMAKELETSTLAAGCFWCIEAVFDDLKGVEDVVSGYAGGHTENPNYRQVCEGNTGHAEVAQIKFDPSVISFKDVLRVFFSVHDPTTMNRQGNDIGTQYRSAIFYHDEQQKRDAQDVIKEITDEGVYD